MARPAEIAALAEALGCAGRTAEAASEELLDTLAVLGDRSTQDAVDGLVDEIAGVLREVSAATQELTLGLAALGGGPADDGSPRTVTPADAAAPDASAAPAARQGRR